MEGSGSGQNGNGTLTKAIATAATLFALVFGVAAIVNPLYWQVEFLSSTVAEQSSQAREDAYSAGKVDQQIADLRANQGKLITDNADLDVRLQREMRDVNAVTAAKLEEVVRYLESRNDELDRRLQGEIKTVADLLKSLIQEITRRVDAGEERQNQNRLDNAKQYERLKAIDSKKR